MVGPCVDLESTLGNLLSPLLLRSGSVPLPGSCKPLISSPEPQTVMLSHCGYFLCEWQCPWLDAETQKGVGGGGSQEEALGKGRFEEQISPESSHPAS